MPALCGRDARPLGIAGVLVGFTTFLGLRQWGQQRRRRQFLADALPRAYLPSKT